MKINNQINFIEITKSSSSLYSLMADGQYRSTSLGRDKWKSVVGDDASLQLTCNIRKGSMQSVPWLHAPKQESLSLPTRTEIATPVIPGSGLALEATMMTLTHVETSLNLMQIMVINSLKLWGTFWYSERHPAKNYLIIRYILRQIWALLVHYYTVLTLYVETWLHIAAWLKKKKKKKTFRQIRLLRAKQTFSAKNISKEANINKHCNLCFFSLLFLSFPSLSLFPISFSFVCAIF